MLQGFHLDLALLQLVQIGRLLDLLHGVALGVRPVVLHLGLPLVQFVIEFAQIVRLLLGDH